MDAPAGVRRRRPGEARPLKYRRHPEPQGEFHEEAADEAQRVAQQLKFDSHRRRTR